MMIDVARWSLVSLALASACGPQIAADGTGAQDPTNGPQPGDTYDDPDSADEYGDDDCWECCDGDCVPPDECYVDDDCGDGYFCESNACVPRLPSPLTCAATPIVEEIPLFELDGLLNTVTFIEATPSPGRELLVATDKSVSLVASDGTTQQVIAAATSQVAVADLDGDGDEDIASVVLDYDHLALRVLLADGAAGWTPGPSVAEVGPYLELADLDGDGIVDLVTGKLNEVVSRRGIGDVTFGDEVTIFDGHNSGIEIVRPSGSSTHVDLVIAGEYTLSFQSGTVDFSMHPLMPDVAAFGSGIASGDFDGDGESDMSAIALGPSQGVHTWRSLASSSTALTSWSFGAKVETAAAGDLDADGLDDLVMGTFDGQLVVRHGTADGGADPLDCYVRVGLPSGGYLYGLGDFDGDARADIVVNAGWSVALARLQ